MSWIHDRTLIIDDERAAVESDYWPILSPVGGEIRRLVRTVVAGHGSIAQWSSWLLGNKIHVSPMSDTWLRLHDAEHTKHAADL